VNTAQLGSLVIFSSTTVLESGIFRRGMMKTLPTWYVTFEVQKRGALPKRRSPRETKTFTTEAEARTFARARLSEGLMVFAGTINPHRPRQIILSHHIPDWVADDQDK
jgi:hypothetical protein